MSAGAAMLLWYDIVREQVAEHDEWHTREHFPERVGIPGFLRGRRYVAIRGDLEFFNLYEAQSPQVVAGSDYLTRLNNPTPWTVATVKHFRKVSRSVCRVAATFGRGQGGLAMTWRYDVPDDRAAAHERALAQRVLPELAARPGIAGAHLLIANAEASAVETAEKKARGEGTRVPRWIVVVEGWGDEAPFAATCAAALSDVVLASHGASGAAEAGLYRLQVYRGKTAWTPG